uniref:Protein FAR1-RELATED SEQUENCE n=1 Tax=Lactuca sativa TaxID=4236 RepID=A0A9R1WSY3_LACSA|nr:hypothetical protein LSAT_V11C900506430 [Lactuca sativa]
MDETISRSEAENYFYGLLFNSNLHLIKFSTHLDTALEAQQCVQRKSDHDSRYTNRILKINVFCDIQSDILATMVNFMSIRLEESEELKRFTIKDIDKHPKHHVWKVIQKHISRRDGKNIEKKEEIQSVICEIQFAKLFCIDRLVNDFDKLILFRVGMNEKMTNAVKKTTKNAKPMKNKEAIEILIVNNKGGGRSKKRMKGNNEIPIEKSMNDGRKCQKCGK